MASGHGSYQVCRYRNVHHGPLSAAASCHGYRTWGPGTVPGRRDLFCFVSRSKPTLSSRLHFSTGNYYRVLFV